MGVVGVLSLRPTCNVSEEVAIFVSREAKVANSLGREPEENSSDRVEPQSGGRFVVVPVCCRRFTAQFYSVNVILGLTPKAIC